MLEVKTGRGSGLLSFFGGFGGCVFSGAGTWLEALAFEGLGLKALGVTYSLRDDRVGYGVSGLKGL